MKTMTNSMGWLSQQLKGKEERSKIEKQSKLSLLKVEKKKNKNKTQLPNKFDTDFYLHFYYSEINKILQVEENVMNIAW